MAFKINRTKGAFSKKTTVTKKAQPGVYNSKIDKIVATPDYPIEVSFDIYYKLTDRETGEGYDFKERYVNSDENPRTAEFIDVLEGYGIEVNDFENLIGVEEVVTLDWEIVGGNPYVNIVDRRSSADEE